MKLTKILNSVVLLEGRIDDAQRYLEDAVGDWPVAEPDNPAGIGSGTNLDGVLKHFVSNDPSGNNKYLMWMVRKYIDPNETMTSPNDISSIVKRFHNNVDRLTPALISDMGFYSKARITTAPKNLDSYTDLSTLERIMDEVESIQTKKQKETEAKAGVDKLYEDDRWLLVKPNTFEGSCYYGSATKWCTTSKENPSHFADYASRGNLYYIIDKSHELGDFYKIALFLPHGDGLDEWYDRADNKLQMETKDAIYSMLPQKLVASFVDSHDKSNLLRQEELGGLFSLVEFNEKLTDLMIANKNLQTINTDSGTWVWTEEVGEDIWNWTNTTNNAVVVQATPFQSGRDEIAFDSYGPDDEGYDFHIMAGPESLRNPGIGPEEYLLKDQDSMGHRWKAEDWGTRAFLRLFYMPLLRQQLNKDYFIDAVGEEYETWTPNSYVSTFKFKYPPRKGTMTQKFVEYLTNNPRKTSNQFYEDVLGYSRPRAHNNMFFSSIKDSGIVKMERQGRQFVYSLGPNYHAWKEGRLLRI